jgi:hypothetical protein
MLRDGENAGNASIAAISEPEAPRLGPRGKLSKKKNQAWNECRRRIRGGRSGVTGMSINSSQCYFGAEW